MRRTWENKFAEYLDEQDIEYVHHPERLVTGVGRYEPDFYLPTKDLFIEIKAEFWLQKRNAKQHYKICILRALWDHDIEYRFKEDLIDLGVLDK